MWTAKVYPITTKSVTDQLQLWFSNMDFPMPSDQMGAHNFIRHLNPFAMTIKLHMSLHLLIILNQMVLLKLQLSLSNSSKRLGCLFQLKKLLMLRSQPSDKCHVLMVTALLKYISNANFEVFSRK